MRKREHKEGGEEMGRVQERIGGEVNGAGNDRQRKRN